MSLVDSAYYSDADDIADYREREVERLADRRALSRRAGYRVAGTLRALRMRQAAAGRLVCAEAA